MDEILQYVTDPESGPPPYRAFTMVFGPTLFLTVVHFVAATYRSVNGLGLARYLSIAALALGLAMLVAFFLMGDRIESLGALPGATVLVIVILQLASAVPKGRAALWPDFLYWLGLMAFFTLPALA
ncbi:MAG: hypothetical protein HKO95_04210 [Rhodobacteraceae bacterium]|nr:hypothetical protein [Alphaproteobacteria bacterium]NNF73270.1 hypothetical protein [Paracoccaceae bacterium]NNK65920.1 hypothetical protein [Paracoccaceae bacterium]